MARTRVAASGCRVRVLGGIPFFLLLAAVASAAPLEGIYTAGTSRALSVDGVSDGAFEFTLAIGITDGDIQCSEGDVSCLAVSGRASGNATEFSYQDPDGGGISFIVGDRSIAIMKATGTLGSGRGNAHQLSEIVGVYELSAQGPSSDVAAETIFFQTPSGNISCAIFTADEVYLRCDMRELKPSYTAPPVGCDLDWGTAFGVGATGSRGELVCHGDTLLGTDPITLDYGKTLEAGGFQCLSEKKGLTCRNETGHGFTLSKARQKLF